MSSRIRNSTARPNASRAPMPSTPNRNGSNDALPPYKKPSHPLDANATRQLREIQGRELNNVKRHNKQAIETIRSAAESVNDMLREHSEYMAKRQKKWAAGKSLEVKEAEEEEFEGLEKSVEEATVRLEESMRAIIDSGMGVQRLDETLDWLRENAPRQLEEEYNTQMTQRATQRQSQAASQSQRARDEDGDEAMGDNEPDAPTPGPTPLDGTRVALTGASELYSNRMQRGKDTYMSLSYTARYARNNDYRDYRRIVHDAKYGDNGPVLGHEDTWFADMDTPAPGITNTQAGNTDDDDDLVMDRATISTRCPLTFQPFKEPYTSTKCPHTFEKNAILDFIRSQGRNVPSVECPVSGCDKVGYSTKFRRHLQLV